MAQTKHVETQNLPHYFVTPSLNRQAACLSLDEMNQNKLRLGLVELEIEGLVKYKITLREYSLLNLTIWYFGSEVLS